MADSQRGSVWHEVVDGLRRMLGGPASTDQPFAQLLDLLVLGGRLRDEVKEREVDANAVSFRAPREEEEQLARDEMAAARKDLPDFERALIDAWRRSGGRGSEVACESKDPAQDRAADVLIRYLVTTRAASVRTEEHAEQEYTYFISVDWETLFLLAEHAGIALRPALERGSAAPAAG
jgi:hypothetical protein